MYLYKISSSILMLAVCVGSLAASFTLAPAAFAQSDVVGFGQCPLVGGVETRLPPGEGVVSTDGAVSLDIQLENTSDFILPGVRAGIVLFAGDQSDFPAYWYLSDQTFQLGPDGGAVARIEADVASVPAGTYTAIPFAGQGDDMNLLGLAVRNGVSSAGFTLERTGTADRLVEQSVIVNGGPMPDGSTIAPVPFLEVSTQTENPAELPLIATDAVVAVVQGEVPLGDAIRAERTDEVRLIPQAERLTVVADVAPQSGPYSVVSAIKRGDGFAPITQLSFEIEGQGPIAWPYLAAVGLSGDLADPETEVVACVDYVGEYAGATSLLDTVAIDFRLSTEAGETLAEARGTNEDADAGTAFTFVPALATSDATLTTTLLTERFPGNPLEPSEVPEGEEPIGLEFEPVHTITGMVSCQSEEGCADGADDGSSLSIPLMSDGPTSNQFWFYLGIVLAAALLMYIMLRRMHPESTPSPQETKGTDDEQMHMPE